MPYHTQLLLNDTKNVDVEGSHVTGCSGRPFMLTIQDNTDRVKSIIMLVRQKTDRVTAESVAISTGTVHSILIDKLKLQKITA